MHRLDHRRWFGLTILVLVAGAFCVAPSPAADPAPPGTRLNNLKVLSDKIDDVTTPENILKSFVKPDEMTGNSTVGLLSFRVDATYVDSRGSKQVEPFFVTHRWKENGKAMEKRMKIEKLPLQYRIETAAEPEMVSVTYEMPAK